MWCTVFPHVYKTGEKGDTARCPFMNLARAQNKHVCICTRLLNFWRKLSHFFIHYTIQTRKYLVMIVLYIILNFWLYYRTHFFFFFLHYKNHCYLNKWQSCFYTTCPSITHSQVQWALTQHRLYWFTPLKQALSHTT
jgi:cellulose synthase/poly-beta-1,6-N-acetylglucosamine synthase-like glycosyltransferase